MVYTNLSSDRDGPATTKWMETQVEIDELPNTWRKFICLKNNIPIKKLVKYQDPEGNNYKNLQLAQQAFERTKSGGTVNSHRRKQSLPLNIEEVNLHNNVSRSDITGTQDIKGPGQEKILASCIQDKSRNIN